MTVRAVGQNDNSKLHTIIGSTATGLGTGYALKWLWPLQKSEDDMSMRTLLNYCYKITNKRQAEDFSLQAEKTPAQDMFIKFIKEEQEGIVKEAFTVDNKAKKVALLGGEDSLAGREFRMIVRCVDEVAHDIAKQFATSYRLMKKSARQTVPFLVAGAGVGFLAGFARNVMKTDIDA